MVVNPRIEYINNESIRMSNECTDSSIFLVQLNRLLLNIFHDEHTYMEGNQHIDEIIIVYKYLYNHIQYIIHSDGIELLCNILKTSTIFMGRINKLKEDIELDETKCPSYLRNMAEDIIYNTVELISSKLSERLSILESHNII